MKTIDKFETISSIIEELMYGYIKAKGEEPTLLIMNTELFNKLCDEYTIKGIPITGTLHFRGIKVELNLEMEQEVILLR